VSNVTKIFVQLLILLIIVSPTYVHAQEIKKGMPFLTTRNMLKIKGWQPINVHEGKDFSYLGVEKILLNAQIKEVESCAMDKAICIFNYKKGDKCLRLFTQGEEIKDMRVTYWTDDCTEGDSNFKTSPDNKRKIVWECISDPQDSNIYTRKCNIFALDTTGKKEWIHQEQNLPEPTVKWHNNSLAEVHIPCGSPCFYSIFYDTNKGVSEPYEFVIAVNADKYVIARAGESNIFINNIFQNSGKSIKQISRNFGETAALVLVIENAYFTKTGNLFIRYLSGKNYMPKEETIRIKYPKQK